MTADHAASAAADAALRHAARRAALAAVLTERGTPALLVTDLVNVRYLTGFTGSNAALLVWADPDRPSVFSTDGRYIEQAAEQTPDLPAQISRDAVAPLLAAAGKAGTTGKALGFEARNLTFTAHTALRDQAPELTLEPTIDLVEGLRMVKDEHEVGLLRRACGIADTALATLLSREGIRPGRTERQVARELEWLMYEGGADGISFETIVAAGANSAVPHHRPTAAVLEEGDLVKLDFGAQLGGYHSDMTRTFVLGECAQWQRDTYDLVSEAQQAGLDAVVPGALASAVDAAARSVIAAAGLGELFAHGLGHGVGLQIHEAPGIGSSATGTLPCGAAVTVEPGVYHARRGGVRIEDTVIVRDGGPEILTLTTKELLVL